MRIRVSSLVLKDSTRVELADPGVTVIVGPNNSGKTLLLREIVQLLEIANLAPQSLKILSALEIHKEGTADELLAWLEQQGFARPNDPSTRYETSYWLSGQTMTAEQARRLWENRPILGQLTRNVANYLSTDSRLALTGHASVPNLYAAPDPQQQQPLQILYRDREATARLSSLVDRAFGKVVTLNRYGGEMRLHLGVPSEPETAPPPSKAYVDELLSLPVVAEQGDGVRSFVGLLLHTMQEKPLVLIDEPEAFLHPPQARLLGRILVEQTPKDAQLIMATHSDDVLQGVLAARDCPISVIRLTRDDDHAMMRVLDPAAIRTLWADPLIRYSQLLDGLFHEAVLICESEADCRFYAAVFDELIGNDFGPALLITHCGGKARLGKAVLAVVQFGLRAGVIADLDVLADSSMLADLIRALGGEWAAFERDHNVVASNVANLGQASEISDLRSRLNDLLDGQTGRLNAEMAKGARRLFTARSGWEEIKIGGTARLPAGDAAQAAERLLVSLAKLGLFLVPVGELERWVTTEGGHGPEWVSRVLEGSKHLPLRLDLADFGRRALAYLGDSAATPTAGS